MTNNMAIGPSLYVGGNEIRETVNGKIQVTNPKGKVKTISSDQFIKQTLKNIDKIQNGEDFEYKKNNKALKIAGTAAGTAAVVTGVIYRKEIGRYMRNFTFKKLWQDVKGLFSSVKKGSNKPVEGSNQPRYEQTLKKRKDARAAFENYEPGKTVLTKRKHLKPDGTVMTTDEKKAANRKARK